MKKRKRSHQDRMGYIWTWTSDKTIRAFQLQSGICIKDWGVRLSFSKQGVFFEIKIQILCMYFQLSIPGVIEMPVELFEARDSNPIQK